MNKPGDKYRPSNGTEGEIFEENYCAKCRFYDAQEGVLTVCSKELQDRAMIFDIDSPKYPSEWTYTEQGKPTCTAWQPQPTKEEREEERRLERQRQREKKRKQLEAAGQLSMFA